MWHCQELILMCPAGKRRGGRSRGDDAACQSWAVVALLSSEDGAGGRKRRKESIRCWACGRCFCLTKTALPLTTSRELQAPAWAGKVDRSVDWAACVLQTLTFPKALAYFFLGLVLCCWLKSKIWKENHRRLCICLPLLKSQAVLCRTILVYMSIFLWNLSELLSLPQYDKYLLNINAYDI